MATISNTPRPGYVWDATDNCWYPIGTGPHSHADYITAGSAINPNIVDAKGDLIAGVAADSVNRLAVGSNDQVLVADSSTSTGLAWRSVATPFAAGKNKVINGDFGIWQRGTSFTNVSASFQYVADRFQAGANAATTTHTITRETFTPGTAPVAGYEGKFFYRSTLTNIGSATVIALYHKMEDVQTLAGQTATVSFWAKADSARNLNLTLDQNFGSGGSSVVSVGSANFTLSTSWTRYTVTFSVPSISGKTIGTNSHLLLTLNQTVVNGSILDLWGVQVEAGPVATPFQTATGTLQGELAACQRYYVRLNNPGDSGAPLSSSALNYSTTQGFALFALPVPLRTSATSMEFSAIRYVDSFVQIFTPTFTNGGSTGNVAKADFSTTGMTQGRPGWVSQNSSTSGFIAFSAEL